MTDDPSADGLPSDSAIIDFIDGCDTPPSVKEVARAFSLPQESRAPLRRRLRELAEQGRIAKQPGRRIAAPDQLPEVTVLIVRKIERPQRAQLPKLLREASQLVAVRHQHLQSAQGADCRWQPSEGVIVEHQRLHRLGQRPDEAVWQLCTAKHPGEHH